MEITQNGFITPARPAGAITLSGHANGRMVTLDLRTNTGKNGKHSSVILTQLALVLSRPRLPKPNDAGLFHVIHLKLTHH